MKVNIIATTKLCLTIIYIVGLNTFSFAQDTLILKPTKKKPQGDTLIVKLAMVYYAKEISYFPYDNFELTKRDKKLLRIGKMITRKGQKEIDAFLVEKILYDENLKHTVHFVTKNADKIERYKELGNIKNIVSMGFTYTSPGTSSVFDIDVDIEIFGSSDTEPEYIQQDIFFLQPTYERLLYKGRLGLRVSPLMVGLNRKAIGSGIGGRLYFRKQRPLNFAVGMDFSFVNSTLFREAVSKSENTNYYNNTMFKRENRNELYLIPVIVQGSYTLKNNYYFSLDISYGARHLLSNKHFTYEDKTYKYTNFPLYGQLRLNIGKKF